MIYILNIEYIIGISLIIVFLIIKIFMLLVSKFQNLRYSKEHKKQKKNYNDIKEIATQIIDEFEELLYVNDIKIPNSNREGNEDEACIYGDDYYNLEESIIEILERNELNEW